MRFTCLAQRLALLFGYLLYLTFTAPSPTLQAQDRNPGSAIVGLQTYTESNEPGQSVTQLGFRLALQQTLPGRGLFSLSLNTVAGDQGFRYGQNFVAVHGLDLWGGRTTATVGDFTAPLDLFTTHFTNLFVPAIYLFGSSLEYKRSHLRVTAYGGRNLQLLGPYIQFMKSAPDTVFSVQSLYQPRPRLSLEARYFFTRARTPAEFQGLPEAFLIFRVPAHASVLLLDGRYEVRKNLLWMSQLGVSHATPQPGSADLGLRRGIVSFFTGPVLTGRNYNLQANYSRQGVDYLPISNQFLGDRGGGNITGDYRLGKRWSFNGSLSNLRNNFEDNPRVPSFEATGKTGGFNFAPGRGFNFAMNFDSNGIHAQTSNGPRQDRLRSVRFQLFKSYRSYLSVVRVERLTTNSWAQERLKTTIKSEDFEQHKLFHGGDSLFAGVRVQHSDLGTSQQLNNISTRVGGNVTIRRALSLNVNAEFGRDLANETLFSTKTTRSVLAGFRLRLPKDYALSGQVIHNSVVSALNPESIFFARGLGGAVTVFPALSRRVFYFQLTKSFHWGKGEPLPIGVSPEVVERLIPTYGVVEGYAFNDRNQNGMRDQGEEPLPYVELSLNGVQVTTGQDGHFRFPTIRTGTYTLRIVVDHLPAFYSTPPQTEMQVEVRQGGNPFIWVPLQVLGSISGHVDIEGPEGTLTGYEGAAVVLNPGEHATFTDAKGDYRFANLPPGEYVVQIRPDLLPQYSKLTSPPEFRIKLASGTDMRGINFKFRVETPQRPVQKIEQPPQEIIIPPPQPPSQTPPGPLRRKNNRQR